MKRLIPLSLVIILLQGCASVSQVGSMRMGMTEEQVTEELGDPVSINFDGESMFYTFRLQKASKPLQYVLATPTAGIIFLFQQDHWFQFHEGKLVNFGINEDYESGQRGGQAALMFMESMGRLMQDQSTY